MVYYTLKKVYSLIIPYCNIMLNLFTRFVNSSMKLISKLLSSFRSKPKNTDITPVPEKNIIVVNTPEYKPTDVQRVATISSDDGLIFNEEGLPTNVTENAYTITKRNFTPSHVYAEPAFFPWAEQNRIKNIQQQINPVAATSPQPLPSETPVNVPDDNGNVSVYNGYPIMFTTSTGNKIAINNRGDTIFNTKDDYRLANESGALVATGKFTEVLNCDLFNREKIRSIQGDVLIV